MQLITAIEEYLASLRSERGLSRNTVTAYARDLQQYAEFLAEQGEMETSAITPAGVKAFVAAIAATGVAASTVARKVAAVRGLHRFLVAEGLAAHDPAAQVDSPKLPSSLPKALTVDQIERLLEGPDPSTPLGLRDRALLEFMYASGARVAETVDLQLVDIDLIERSALVTGKGAKQRIVPLGRLAVEALERYLPVRLELKRGGDDPGWVFLNVRGGKLSRQGVFLIVRRSAVAAGLEPDEVSPHVLRHSAATHMVEGGADLRTVQEILGHASISTTQIYTRVSPQHLYEVFLTSHPRSR
ncbi:MAG TPA: site-specific tyrosine recombinase XerD [Acidimicrobiia bacterium]|nr:site-specific tyrosine recombinase XerD [Acidimicrobiia bacterium]